MSAPPSTHPAPAGARHFAGDSLKTGAYQFIPLPFVDDWLTARQRRGMVRAILDARGIRYDGGVPRLLAGGSRSWGARMMSMAKGAVQKPLRKVFRTVFFWLAARRAALAVVETYFLGRFLHHPALAEQGDRLTAAEARRLAEIFEMVAKNLDLRAAREVVAKVRRLLRGRPRGQVTAGELRGTIEEEAPGFIAEFDRVVAQKLAGHHHS